MEVIIAFLADILRGQIYPLYQLPAEGGEQHVLGGGNGFAVFLLMKCQNPLEIRLHRGLCAQLRGSALETALQVVGEPTQHAVGEAEHPV